MPNSIRLKKSGVAGKVPQVTDLSISELSYNYADGVLYGKRTSGGLENIVEFACSENHHLLKHLATPGIPASGYSRFYAKADNNFYLRTSAGEERQFLTFSGTPNLGETLVFDGLSWQKNSEIRSDRGGEYNTIYIRSAESIPEFGDSEIYMSAEEGIFFRTNIYNINSAEIIFNRFGITSSKLAGFGERFLTVDAGGTIKVATNQPIALVQENRLLGRIAGEGAGPIQEIRLGDTLEFDQYGVLNATVSGGGGTVTSVGLSMPNIFSVSNSPVTTTGVLSASLVSQTKSKVLASPHNASGVPSFRALLPEDMPDLSNMYDNYYCWNVKFNSGSYYQILKAGSSVYSGAYNGINFIAGSGIEINESSLAGGALGITISSQFTQNESSFVTYASSTTVATGGAFTAISNRSLPSIGTYLILVQITCSFTSALNNVQAKLFTGGLTHSSTHIASPLNDTTIKTTMFYAIVQATTINYVVYLSATALASGASVISNTGISAQGTVMSYIKLI
jgi:hypothetical protein